MSIVSQLTKPDLISLSQTAPNQTELLEKLSDDLIQKGYVFPSFKQALLQRELEFPTGLQLENTAVAIPHTYADHVRTPFLSINRLQEPIPFIQMGTDDVEVSVSYVIVLGISEPKNQTTLLVELMDLFNDPDFINRLQSARHNQEIISLFTNLSTN